MSKESMTSLREKIGLVQWFHYGAYEDLIAAVDVLQGLGVKHLRTNLSWADFVRPGGKAWYDWQMETLHAAGFHILLSVWHVPPSYSVGNACNTPPRRLRDYADFIDQVITLYGDKFHELALWNEPNSRYEWDFESYDPKWEKFGEMVAAAANWAKQRKRTTVLGGMMPVDHTWLKLMEDYGVLSNIDVIAIHAFPEMWWQDFPNWEWYDHWQGWESRVEYVAAHANGRPLWVTETGLATWDPVHERHDRYELQVMMLEQAVAAPVERLYWYCAVDLDPRQSAVEGFHVDENEYHLGLVTYQGEKKPAYYRFQELLAEPAPALVERQESLAS
jgi:CDP-paratose 2-epimerase